ncbi:hypothetical protein BC567DRAFT_293470 [Phyllosticta citribraziliensis]
MTSPDAQSQPPKRPAAPRRSHSSQSSQTQSHSPNDAPHHRSAHKAGRHVVGHSRLGPRNPSYGKNLNKQATQQNHHHQRTLSTGSTSTSTTTTTTDAQARPALKRNASAAVVSRNTSHAQLRKNHSSGHLPRQANKAMHRHHRSSDLEPLAKRASASAATAGAAAAAKPRRKSSPEMDHAGVRFDLGVDDDGDDDNAWTEESASQSPATTRCTTRQNSVILDPPKPQHQQQLQQQQETRSDSSDDTSDSTETDASPRRQPQPNHSRPQQQPQQEPHSDPPSPRDTSRTERPEQRVTYSSNQINGVNSYHQPNLPDADMITSRILQRSASNRLQPQVSDVSATVVSHSHDARSLSHSTGSTMIDTPGNKEAVSRFIDGDGSSGTPRDSSFLPHHQPRPTANNANSNTNTGGDLSARRNKSTANIPETTTATPSSSSHHRRHVSSGTTTPSDLAPSRTQQKLWLQRASSNIEPQQKAELLAHHHRGSSSAALAAPNGHAHPHPHHRHSSSQLVVLARRFDEAAAEYRVVRRFRNPVADAIARLADSPDSPRWRYVREQQQLAQRERDGSGYYAQSQRHMSSASATASAAAAAYQHLSNGNTASAASPLSKTASALHLNRPSTQGGTDREVRTNGLRSSSAATLVSSPASTTPGGGSGGGGGSATAHPNGVDAATPRSVMEAVAAARRARVSFDLPGRAASPAPAQTLSPSQSTLSALNPQANSDGSTEERERERERDRQGERVRQRQQQQQQQQQQQRQRLAEEQDRQSDVVEELCRRIWDRCDGEGALLVGGVGGAE